MAVNHQYIKEFSEVKGLDLRSSDLNRDPNAATSTLNCMLRQTSALNKRPGYTRKAISAGGYGASVFHNISLTTGAVTEEKITLDSSLYKLTSATLTLAYNGAAEATYSVYADGTQINFYLLLDGVVTSTFGLGTGSEGSPVTITSLVASINAITDFVAVGASTVPAAFLDVAYNESLSAVAVSISYDIWTAISTPTNYVNPITPAQTTPFYNYLANKTVAGFENASIVEVNDVMYIATGLDELHKYDGTRVYRAGMPDGVIPTAADSGVAGGPADTTYYYKITYSYTDAKSNIVEGAISPVSAVVNPAGTNKINVTYYNIRHTYTGAGPAGVSATLYPNANYKGFDTQSANLMVNIWRSTSATGIFSLVVSQANDPASDTTTYLDAVTAANLGATFVDPVKTPKLPPKCKYLDVWRNMLIMSGNPTAVNTVYYADIEGGNEVFPENNAFDVDSKVTGLRSLDNILGVFRERAIDGVTGDLAVDSLQVDHISRDGIGCAANASIQEINGALFFLSSRGVYRISQAGGMEHIGLPISPKFQAGNPFTFKQATSVKWNDKFLYLLHMPVNPVDPSYSTNATSETLAYDYQRGAWFDWDNFNMMGGTIQLDDGTLYILERLLGVNNTHKLKKTLTPYDFSDHSEAIDFEYFTHWETLGEPSIYKKFLRLKMHSYDVSLDDFENPAFSLNLITQHDYLNQDITDLDLDFSTGTSGWGVDAWGDTEWGDTRLPQVRTKIASRKSKSMRIAFKNSVLHENILISGWEIEAATPYLKDPLPA